MELAGVSLRERTTEALVVGVVFLGVGYIQNDVEWTTVPPRAGTVFRVPAVSRRRMDGDPRMNGRLGECLR